MKIVIQIFAVFTSCFLFLNVPSLCLAEDAPSFDDSFKLGVTHYQNQKYEEAAEQFRRSVNLQPQNVSAVTNLALSEFQLGHKPIAVALLRRALALDPDFSTPQAALKFILPQLELREIPHEIQLKESLRTQLLAPVPVVAYLFLAVLTFFASGWGLISYFGARQRAIKNELPSPPFPTLALIFLFGFLISFSLSLAKWIDFQIPRGTVVADKVLVMSAPDAQAVGLFELYGGHEVILDVAKDDWVQVTYPGALSGWVQKTALLHTSGKSIW